MVHASGPAWKPVKNQKRPSKKKIGTGPLAFKRKETHEYSSCKGKPPNKSISEGRVPWEASFPPESKTKLMKGGGGIGREARSVGRTRQFAIGRALKTMKAHKQKDLNRVGWRGEKVGDAEGYKSRSN